MATGKTRQVSVTRAQKLPPIREETFSSRGGSARISVKPQSKYEVLRTTSKSPKLRPTVHARPLPADRSKSPKEQVSPQYRSPRNPAPAYLAPMTPLDTTSTLVDGLVADYLHFARYGHIIPLYEGSSNLTCPCCTERNRENVRTLLGFPSNQGGKKARHSDDPSQSGEFTHSHHGGLHPESSVSGATFNRKLVDGERQRAMDRSWLNHQPLPYASNYLNPEFNRPAVVYNYNLNQKSPRDDFVRNEVNSASHQYELSMAKLEKFGF